MPDIDLAAVPPFPDTTISDWSNLAESFLKGAAFDTLVHRTEDGIIKGPLSTRADISTDIAPYFRKDIPLLDQRDWHISAPVSDPNISFANRQLLEDLNGGASAARITCGVDGVAIRHKNDLKRLLDQVFTDLIPIYLAPHEDGFVFKLFENYEKSHLNLGLSPRTADLETYTRECPENWKLVTLDAAQIYDRGGTDVQELAYLAASAAYTFRQLGPEPASRHISAELATHQDGHVSIAKLRAARRIYARIAQSFGIENQSLSLHAITAKRMMQKIDPWTNMLRVMSAGFGAVIGGADFITTRPFTQALGNATPFGYRIARNMQLLMMEESRLGQVKDAAFGSYHHERLTDALAQKAWAEFQQIEGEGGFENLAPFNARIDQAIAARQDQDHPILGVNLHPTDNGRVAKIRTAVTGDVK